MAYKNFYSDNVSSSSFSTTISNFPSWWSTNKGSVGQGIEVGSNKSYLSATSTTKKFGEYVIYKLKKSTVLLVSTPIFWLFKSNDVLHSAKANPQNNFTYSIKKSSTKSAYPKFESGETGSDGYNYAYAIKLQATNGVWYYYFIGYEIDQSEDVYTTSDEVSPVPSSFKPYQSVEFTTKPSVKVTKTPTTFNSNAITTGTSSSSTVYYSFSSSYSGPQSARGYASWGDWDDAIYITITDWDEKYYEIKENATDYNVYAGKTVGDDFLNHFSLAYTCSNEYKTIQTIVQSSLDINGLSKTKYFSVDNTVELNYTYEDVQLSYSTDKKIIQLADEKNRFNLISITTSYKQGEYFDSSKIDIKKSGYLLYEDGTSIALSEIEWMDEPSITSSIDDPITLDEGILGFDLTYYMPTAHFGPLSYTFHVEVSGQTEDYITKVVLDNVVTGFQANSILDFILSSAQLLCYNYNDELIKTIPSSDFGQYITEYPEYYGKKIPEIYHIDEPITLTFGFQKYREFDWTIYVSYYENSLKIDYSKAKRKYYIGGKYGDTITLDSSNISAIAIHHENRPNSLGSITEYDVSDKIALSCDDIDVLTGTKVYSVTVSYTDDIQSTRQTLTNHFDIEVTKYEPKNIEITGNNDTIHYWDNNVDVFHHPTGLIFNRVYSDGTLEEITDLSELQFYRDEGLTKRLVVGSSIIKENEGSRIYVLDPTTNVSGYYIIEFDVDTIINVTLENKISFVLGNKFNSIRNELEIRALYQSGVISDLEEYTFKNNNFILKKTEMIIIVDEAEYTLDDTKITFIKPNISNISLDTSKFPLTYNNISDAIDASSLIATVSYENAEYTEKCYFKNGQVIENDNEFLVSCNDLPTYQFDGSKDLELEMGDYFERKLTLNISVRNKFDNENTTNSSVELTVSVIEITEITGLSLVRIYTDYYVNDTFLNENDTTQVQIFYKDANGIQKKLQVKLNSDFSALNIFPLKGTKFTNVTNSRTIKITSATNYNVCCEYTITVSSKYNYSGTNSHDVVAVYQGAYITPNGEGITDKYLLVARTDEQGNNNTKINSQGERVLVDTKIIDDVKVYGYLDDVFDESKNARVILFDDYIAPVEGTNNITVKFPCYVEGNADIINKCRFGILFGNNNAKNRLFVSGNKSIPNCDWHSGQIDSNYLEDESMINGNFGYFEDTSYCYYGETDNAIVGYDIVSNDKLLVLKNKSDKETTIYFRTPTLLQAIDAAGTAMTGVDGETLYQEEFSLIKGNNSVAAVSSKGVVNFNGDSLFLSDDKNMVGLDLIGIIGDNQRYANSRSIYIDEDLKKYDMNKSWLWSNNKDLYLVLNDKIFVTHYEAKGDNQYEWWVMNIKDIQSIIEVNNVRYLANSQGQLYKLSNNYDDVDKIFIGQGGSLLYTEGTENDEVIVSQQVIEQLDGGKYLFKTISSGNDDVSYMYYQIATISNVKNGTFDFYVNKEKNCLELLGFVNGDTDYNIVNNVTNLISESKYIYLNHADKENEIAAFPDSPLKTYYKKYLLKRYFTDEDILSNDCYKLIDGETNEEVDISQLYRASICYRLDDEYEMVEINKDACSFKLKYNDKIINLTRYADQDISRSFKAEIKRYKPVEAYFITKPFTMGSLDYFKTIWSWTLTNDTSIPSELEIAIANNKIPFDSMRTLASISKDKFSFDLNDFDFRKVDLQKNIVPRTYTNQRIISQLKFVCFGFRNFNNTNSVLSSMSIIYTIPFPSYGGD